MTASVRTSKGVLPRRLQLIFHQVGVVLGLSVREIIPVEQCVVNVIEVAVVEIAVHRVKAVENDAAAVMPRDINDRGRFLQRGLPFDEAT
jgi:hypothetical protein